MKLARKLEPHRMFQIVWDNFQELIGLGFTGGREFTVDVSSGANLISHGLGRAPKGWLVLRSIGAYSIYEQADSSTSEHLYLIMTATGSARITLRVW